MAPMQHSGGGQVVARGMRGFGSYEGPGVPVSDLRLHRGSEFQVINAVPIKNDWWVGGKDAAPPPWVSFGQVTSEEAVSRRWKYAALTLAGLIVAQFFWWDRKAPWVLRGGRSR